ncbi:DUF1802 family protein [soil metagenome]
MADSFPTSLNVGLKEWDVVCRALGEGRQTILLRKGGISEGIGGFEIEHRKFLLFPTFLHQKLEMLKPAEQAKMVARADEPDQIHIGYAGEITDILQINSREQMDQLEAEHIWARPLIDMRFNYKPKNPLYLLIVRAHTLKHAVTIANTPDYAGCKSWVPLGNAVMFDAMPAIADASFEARRASILSHWV